MEDKNTQNINEMIEFLSTIYPVRKRGVSPIPRNQKCFQLVSIGTANNPNGIFKTMWSWLIEGQIILTQEKNQVCIDVMIKDHINEDHGANEEKILKDLWKVAKKNEVKALTAKKHDIDRLSDEDIIALSVTHCIGFIEIYTRTQNKPKRCMVMPKNKGGTLYLRLLNNRFGDNNLSLERVRKFIVPTMRCILALHRTARIAHCDLKADNVCIRISPAGEERVEDDEISIIDFTEARGVKDLKTYTGRRLEQRQKYSFYHPSHEAITGGQEDLYSLGVLIVQILSGNTLIYRCEFDETFQNMYESTKMKTHDETKKIREVLDIAKLCMKGNITLDRAHDLLLQLTLASRMI